MRRRVGLDDMKVKILDPTGTPTPIPRSSSPQPVAIPTELPWLSWEENMRQQSNWIECGIWL